MFSGATLDRARLRVLSAHELEHEAVRRMLAAECRLQQIGGREVAADPHLQRAFREMDRRESLRLRTLG